MLLGDELILFDGILDHLVSQTLYITGSSTFDVSCINSTGVVIGSPYIFRQFLAGLHLQKSYAQIIFKLSLQLLVGILPPGLQRCVNVLCIHPIVVDRTQFRCRPSPAGLKGIFEHHHNILLLVLVHNCFFQYID